jgi:GNAT superfamily N-acetyltransferase
VRAGRCRPPAYAAPVTYGLIPAQTLPPAGIDLVRRIYEDGFPAHQRADFASLLGGRQPGELALALTGPGAVPCGFAMLRPLGPTGWIFLRYFVVDAAQRGRGLGGVLWDELTGLLRESGYSLLIFDVDDPDEPGCPPDEAAIRRRRIAFYERHGAAVLPVTGYRTPDGPGPEPDWTPMLLLAAGLEAGDPPTATAGGLRAVAGAVYRYRWSLAPDHPQVRRTGYAGGRHGPTG